MLYQEPRFTLTWYEEETVTAIVAGMDRLHGEECGCDAHHKRPEKLRIPPNIEMARRYPLEKMLFIYFPRLDWDYRGQTLCPFHDDHDPSLGTFEGYDGRTRYKCFACDASGDVIDLVKAVEGVNFNRALYLLNVLEWSTTPEATAFLLALGVVGEGA